MAKIFALAMLLAVVCLLNSGSEAITFHKPEHKGTPPLELMRYMSSSCYSECQELLKGSTLNCEKFCLFVSHVVDHHPIIFKQFNKFGEPWDAIDWAMRDSCLYRVQTNEEDDHTLALQFIRSFAHWARYAQQEAEKNKKSRHDEL